MYYVHDLIINIVREQHSFPASIHSGGHVSGRPYLSSRVLPFTSVTHFYVGYYSIIDPGRMKG